MKQADGVAAAADASDADIGQLARHLLNLLARFNADDALKVAHHHRIGMRTKRRSKQVKGRLDIGHPVAHGFVDGIFERAAAALDRDDLGAEQLHAEDIRLLPADIDRAHINMTFQAQQRHRRGPCRRRAAQRRFRR